MPAPPLRCVISYALGLTFLEQPADAAVHRVDSGSPGLVHGFPGAGSGIATLLEQVVHQVGWHRALRE